MEHNFTILRQSRENLVQLIEKYPGKLHEVPPGYNNNLWWNAAHILVTQQLLCYGLCGLPFTIDDSWIDRYRKGTHPPRNVKYSWSDLRPLLLQTPNQLEEDYQAGKFQQFKAYDTSYQLTLNSPEEAIRFNNVHEGLHLGYMMALARQL